MLPLSGKDLLPLYSQHLVSSSIPEPNLGEDDEDKDLEPGPSGTSKASAQISGQSDTDITAEFLQPLLTPDNVANLVRSGGGCSPPSRGTGLSSFPCPQATLPISCRRHQPQSISLFSVLGAVALFPSMDLFSDLYSFEGHLSPLPAVPLQVV